MAERPVASVTDTSLTLAITRGATYPFYRILNVLGRLRGTEGFGDGRLRALILRARNSTRVRDLQPEVRREGGAPNATGKHRAVPERITNRCHLHATGELVQDLLSLYVSQRGKAT